MSDLSRVGAHSIKHLSLGKIPSGGRGSLAGRERQTIITAGEQVTGAYMELVAACDRAVTKLADAPDPVRRGGVRSLEAGSVQFIANMRRQ
jgi:hypothetical protein